MLTLVYVNNNVEWPNRPQILGSLTLCYRTGLSDFPSSVFVTYAWTNMSMARRERSFIYAKDIMKNTGRSKTYAFGLLKKIKAFFSKDDYQLVTIDEYARFHGIPVEKVMEYL